MRNSHIAPLQTAIDLFGSGAALARALRVSRAAVSQWTQQGDFGRLIPHRHCVRIEQLTSGAVTRRQLRPDDWFEIWPELAHAPAAPAQPSATPHQPVQPAGAAHADLQGVA